MTHFNVLLIGSGGREHAISWCLSKSDKVEHIFVAPGNAGCGQLSKVILVHDLNLQNYEEIVEFCCHKKISLVVVGPEDPLANGISDYLTKNGIKCFGPSKAAAQIEASKAFSKDFMARHNIPTARYKTFTSADEAEKHINSAPYKALVVKASGLAAGKGVVVASDAQEACRVAREMLEQKTFGSACDQIVVEELLEGTEVSALCFTDGNTVHLMPIAQDHKRLLDGDKGPNTGGIGAYAPCSWLEPKMVEFIEQDVLQKTVDALRNEGIVCKGVLYAGLMLCADGPRVLEYNCRFGDPETQSILPLLSSDLIDIMFSCVDGNLDLCPIEWRNDLTACGIVIVSGGYPGNYAKGVAISGLETPLPPNVLLFHAGTKRNASGIYVTSGGRVLNIVGLGPNLAQSKAQAMKVTQTVTFDNCFYRKDIGHKQLEQKFKKTQLTYDSSGVSIIEGNNFVTDIKPLCAATRRPGCDDLIGGFGAAFDLRGAGYSNPVLVMGTDGVGTKLQISEETSNYGSIGIDLVAMCVNDVLCHGAEPLAFLDYYVTGKLERTHATQVVKGICEGCKIAGCALVGGETAEMPGVYSPKQWDLAGFVVGALNNDQPRLPAIDKITPGDVVLALPSSGLHSNGYSLVRKIVQKLSLDYNAACPWNKDKTLGEDLLTPTKIYVKSVLPVIRNGLLKAVAHITGGGLLENIPRVLPRNMAVSLVASQWEMPQVYPWLATHGPVSAAEISRTFNCGLGLVLIVGAEQTDTVMEQLNSDGIVEVGQVVERNCEELQVQISGLERALTLDEQISNGYHMDGEKTKVAVLISGSGTNLQALIDQTLKPDSKCQIALVISNVASAKGLARAQSHGIETKVLSHKGYANREEYDKIIDAELNAANVELVCLAGFMRILSSWFTIKWTGRLINTHPSLLPAFKGAHAHRDALRAGVRVSGCSVHFVTAEVDVGAIIDQSAVSVHSNDTEECLSERVKQQEHIIYPTCMEKVAQGIVKLIEGKIVRTD